MLIFFLWGQNTKEVEMEFEQKSLVFWVVLGDVQSDRWPITGISGDSRVC